MVTIGIDIGGSTTKIVGFSSDTTHTLIEPLSVRATDPITSVYGAFGKFLTENGLELSDIDRVAITGVGSKYITKPLYGLPCENVPEFRCIGLGGLYLSGLSDALVVSMGTGTALVHASTDKGMNYLGGTGVGGGTLMGLSKLLLKAETIEHIEEYAAVGNLANIDLRIKDISAEDAVSVLDADLTASNFGNVSDLATKDDLALGIMNVVYETIGMVSVFAARSVGVDNVVLTGNLTRLGFCSEKFDYFNGMKKNYGVNFIIPERSEFATVIGTAILGF